MKFYNRKLLFVLFVLTFHFAFAQSHIDDLPELSISVYSDLANGCRNNKNMKYLIAGTWRLMFEDEVQSKITLIKSCNKEAAYKLLTALYEIQPDSFKENLHAIGLSIKDCQECESALLNVKEKELEKIKANESAIFDKWMKDGVPDGVKPSVNASLKYSGIAKTAAFMESIDKNDKIDYLLKLEINSDGSVCSIYPNAEELMDSTRLFSLFSFDELSVEQPAYYDFANLNKGIAMSSIEKIHIKESRKSITHYEPWDAPEYQCGDFDRFTLTIKYNLDKNTIKVVKGVDDEYYYNNFCNRNDLDSQHFIDDNLRSYLKSKGLNGKIRVCFQLRNRKIVVSQSGVGVLAEQEISPKLIVVKIL